MLLALSPHALAQSRALAVFQSQETVTFANPHLITIFIVITALALAAQAVAVLVMVAAAMKLRKDLMAEVAEFKTKLMPLVDKSQSLAAEVSAITTDLGPKLSEISKKAASISGHMEQISVLARDKAVEFAPTLSAANQTVAQANQTVADVNRKTQQQVDRVNGMISSTLDATEQLGRSLRRGITQPGRELSGIAAGIKTAVQTLFEQRPRKSEGRYEPGTPARPSGLDL